MTSISARSPSRTAPSPAPARCRAMTASRPARRRCRRAGRTTPIRTSTSTRRAAPTRRRCRSTRSGREGCIRTARSTCPTRDDLGRHWIKGNGGRDLEPNNNQTSLSFGHVEDKQWVAVNHFPGTAFQDHVYAMWTTFNGAAGNGKIRVAVSRDRGQTFSKATTLTPPGTTTPATTYVYPSVGADGTLYVAFVGGFDTTNKNRDRPRLRHEVGRRRGDLRALRRSGLAEREPVRVPAQHQASATASSRTSRPARPTRGTCTSPTRTGTSPRASSTSSSSSPPTAGSRGDRSGP